uniref:Nacht and ankyrin domain protein n=1 Tax=Colletotrichum fructicola (strain Nara gc5) TaxID=1213859 RepID=L2FBA5_COLFN
MKKLDSPEFYTIAWIAALPIERAAAEAHGQPDGFSRNPSDPNSYTWGHIGEHNIVIVSLAAGVYGLGSAAATASSLSSSLPAIRIGLLVGIGGGIARPDEDHDIRLGDVVVSQPDGTTGGVCQYDLVKAKPGDVRERKGFLASPPRVLLNALANIQSVHERKDSEIPRFLEDMLEAYPKMAKKTKTNPGYTHQGFENDRLFQSSYGHVTGQDCRSCGTAEEVQREERESTDPEIHYGIIASGNTLVKDAAARDQILADIGEDCICFEMEAAGLMNHFPCLVIRGICDYSDSHKNDRWQRYASGTAAAYAKELLSYVPAAEIHETKRALEILQSVNEKMGATQETTLSVKATVDAMKLDSHSQKIQKWLAAPNPNTNANHARELRHAGTGAWLLENPAFKNWISGACKQLWLCGMPGCGKTVLSTTILDRLIEDNGLIILSFFFDFRDPRKQNKNGLLRSLALQLYQGGHDSAGHLENSLREHKDGTQSDPGFTEKRLSKDLLRRIHRRVGNGAKGMFRWAACQLDSLAKCYSPNEIGNTLDRLPATLEETYDRTVHNIPQKYMRSAMRLLQFIVHAKRPLTLKEAVEIVATEIEDEEPRFDINCRVFVDSDILRHCTSLVSVVPVETELETIQELHLAHFSVKEYFLSQKNFERINASITITKACLVYLRDIHGHRWKLAEEYPFATYAAQVWLDFAAAAESSEDVSAIIVNFLRSEKAFQRWNFLHEADQGWAGGPRGSVLYYACVGGLLKAARAIIDRGVDVNALEGGHCGNALQAAAFNGHSDVVQLLLNKGANANVQCGEYGNALQAASYRGHLDVARLLLEEGAIINAQGGRFETALQAASKSGHLDVVGLLLHKDANVNIQGEANGNALAAASSGGHIRIVELLLNHGADINAPGGFDGSALQTASSHGHIGIVKMLLKQGADVHMQTRGYGNALNGACARGNLEVVQLLLDKGADIHTQGGFIGNALHAAAYGGNEEIVKMLVDRGADVHATGGQFGSALQAACWGGHEKAVRTIINLGANVNAQGGEYGSPLHAACHSRNGMIAKVLMEFDVDKSLVLRSYHKILDAACHNDREDVLKRLVDLGVKIANSGLDKYLKTACAFGSGSIIKPLVDMGANVNSQGGKHGSPLQAACKSGNRKTVQCLVSLGADVNIATKFGSALHTAAHNGNQCIVEMLIDLGADVNARGSGSVKATNSLFAASYRGHSKVVRTLLSNGAEVSPQDNKGRTPLHVAASNGHIETATILIEAGADVNSAPSDSVWTPLTTASAVGNVEIVKLLLANGASISITDKKGQTPLHKAISGGSVQVVRLLLENGAGSPVTTTKEKRMHLLQKASSKGHVEIVRLLLEKGFNASVENEKGRTPLYIASCYGQAEVVTLLLEKGFSTSTANKRGWTPLFAASSYGHVKVVKLLLDSGADTSLVTEYGWTPLHAASSTGKIEIVNLLLERKADISRATDRGLEPLHIASFYGFANIVSRLLDTGEVLPDDKNVRYGQTPLYYAAGEGHESLVKLLLEDPRVNVDSKDSIGRTALFSAAAEGRGAVVDVLMNHHASVNSTDYYESTPLSMAARRGHSEVVKKLLAAGATSINRDCFHRTPLWWAKRQRKSAVVEILNQSGPGLVVPLDEGTDPEVVAERSQVHSRRSCDICILAIPQDCNYYNCPNCNGGDFDICEDCFASGGRCLEESHATTFRNAEIGDESVEDSKSNSNFSE